MVLLLIKYIDVSFFKNINIKVFILHYVLFVPSVSLHWVQFVLSEKLKLSQINKFNLSQNTKSHGKKALCLLGAPYGLFNRWHIG